MALVAAVLTYALLALGGLVTSRDAGMIFNDYPLSNGSLNPDGWLSNADKFSEHGHRLLGTLVGTASIVLAIMIHRSDTRTWMKWLAWFAVVFVTAQGLLGGFRVWRVNTFMALMHGCTGQIFFGLTVALAYLTSRDAREKPEQGRDTRLLVAVGCGAAVATLMQTILGARVRHIHGPINDHLLGAVVVTGAVIWLVSIVVVLHPRRRALMVPAMIVLGLFLVQVTLGFATAIVLSPDNRTDVVTMWQIANPSVHQAVGALLLAAEVWLTLRALRRREPVRSPEATVAAFEQHQRGMREQRLRGVGA